MRRILAMIILTLGLSLAQGRFYGEALGGTFTLMPELGAIASLRLGAEDVVGSLGLRGDATVLAFGGGSLLGLAVDALYPFRIESNLKLDVGLGLGVLIAAFGGTSATDVQLRALAGFEFPIQGNLALRAEPVLGYSFNAQQANLGIYFGPRLYLR